MLKTDLLDLSFLLNFSIIKPPGSSLPSDSLLKSLSVIPPLLQKFHGETLGTDRGIELVVTVVNNPTCTRSYNGWSFTLCPLELKLRVETVTGVRPITRRDSNKEVHVLLLVLSRLEYPKLPSKFSFLHTFWGSSNRSSIIHDLFVSDTTTIIE